MPPADATPSHHHPPQGPDHDAARAVLARFRDRVRGQLHTALVRELQPDPERGVIDIGDGVDGDGAPAPHDSLALKQLLATFVVRVLTVDNARDVMGAVHGVLEWLIPNLGTRSTYFTALRKLIRRRSGCATCRDDALHAARTACAPTEQHTPTARGGDAPDADGRDKFATLVISKPSPSECVWRRYFKHVVAMRRCNRLALQRQQATRRVVRNRAQHLIAHSTILRVVTDLEREAAAGPDHPFASVCVRILLVQLAVGPRLIEALDVSQFAPIAERPGWIRVHGVAKTHDHRQVDRPVLFLSVSAVLEHVAAIRVHVASECARLRIPRDDRERVSAHYGAAVNEMLRQVMPPEHAALTSHSCRAIFANASYVEHAPPTYSLTAWIARVLGHHESSLDAALNYQAVRVTGFPGFGSGSESEPESEPDPDARGGAVDEDVSGGSAYVGAGTRREASDEGTGGGAGHGSGDADVAGGVMPGGDDVNAAITAAAAHVASTEDEQHSGDSASTVTLYGPGGAAVMFPLFKKARGVRAADALRARAADMLERGVDDSRRHLLLLGFGERAVREYRRLNSSRGRKRKRECDGDDSGGGSPSSSAASDASVEYVSLRDRGGVEHRVAKKPRIRDGQLNRHIAAKVRELEALDIKVTNRTLRKLGCSGRALGEWRANAGKAPAA